MTSDTSQAGGGLFAAPSAAIPAAAPSVAAPADGQNAVLCEANDGFKQWISNYGGSLVFSTRRSGKLCFLGWDGQMVTLMMRQMNAPTGLEMLRGQLLAASRFEISLFADAPLLAYEYDPKNPGAYDACYLPRTTWFVGDLGAGDVLTDREGILFVNTRFSCIARPSFKYHFDPIWKPDFVSALTPEDRCHLSGAAAVEGRLAYVTAFAKSDKPYGWRDALNGGGLLIDARTNEILLDGLKMPHSPRWHKQCLWFLNSGAGELCVMNPETHEVKTVCHLPGLTRGLAFWENYAVVGLSTIRKNDENEKFPVQKQNNITYCGVAIINILTGRAEGLFYFERGCEEIYDIALLPNVHRAALLTPDRPGCFDALTTENYAWWMRTE